MSRARAIAFALSLSLASLALAQDKPTPEGLRELAPSWSPGLEWTIDAHPLMFSMPKDGSGGVLKRDEKRWIHVRFRVGPKRDVGGVACHELHATSDYRPEEEVVMLVRAQDLSVKELRRKTKGSSIESVVENGRAPFVLLETSALCPYDFPLFPAETKDGSKTFDLGDGKKIEQKIATKGDSTEVTLTTEWHGKKLVSTQTWKRGAPFWSSCHRTVDGDDDETGVLDEKSIKLPGAK